MPPIPSLDEGSFTLDVSGIVGFLGGDEAISATESVHFYEHRKYLGFYNTPGSYKVAKHYGKLARGQVWDALYPGVNEEPAAFLKLDGKSGPSYRGIMSGTAISDIGHVGHVFEQLCDDLPVQHSTQKAPVNPISVTVVDLREVRKDAPNRVSISYPATFTSSPWRYIVAFLTCVLNLAICILSALCDEWFAFSLILLGIICNGLACFLIGSARIYLKYHKPSQHSPLGNGIIAEKKHFIVLTGSEEAVNQIVKGSFEVDFGSDASYSRIGFSAVALTIQFLAQLFLAPQCGLLGQILLLATLAISWLNNACLSSIDKESLQKNILKKHLPLHDDIGHKFVMGSRTEAVVFAMLCALPIETLSDVKEREACVRGVLQSMLPTSTTVWNQWTDLVVARVNRIHAAKEASINKPVGGGLLQDLLEKVDLAFEAFEAYKRGGKETDTLKRKSVSTSFSR